MTSANCFSTRASIRSVLANCPIALAKSRAWRGLITTTANPAACSAHATAFSYPPLASISTMSTTSALNFATRASYPSASLLTRSNRSVPHAASKCPLDTSIPAHGRAAVTGSLPCGCTVMTTPCVTVRATRFRNTAPVCVDQILPHELPTLGSHRFGAHPANPPLASRLAVPRRPTALGDGTAPAYSSPAGSRVRCAGLRPPLTRPASPPLV